MKLKKWSFFDILFIISLLVLVGILLGLLLKDINNQAIVYAHQKKYHKAETKWLQALKKNPFSVFYRMNLALNYMFLKKFEKSIKEYTMVQQMILKKELSAEFKIINSQKKSTKHSIKNTILFYSLFNSAIAAHQNKDIKNTLNFYQQALEIRPHSLKVKTNIELLIKDNKKKSNKNKNKNKNKSDKNKKQSQKNNKDKSDKNDKNKSDKSDKNKNDKNKSDKDKKQSEFNKQALKNKQNLNPVQQEAILKSILEQENKIRQRRNKQKKRSTPVSKDW